MSQSRFSTEILQTLPDGLILRRSSAADAEKLSAFNALIHGDDEADQTRVAAWTRDLLNGCHPTFATDDFTIVEEAHSGKIVSTMNLISQTWQYAGIPFKVGRPELVGTDPEYRNRGLVRAQFEIMHQWSQQRGELLQGITGIPFYYRQFGYEMAVHLGGGRLGTAMNVPRLKDGEEEIYRIRPAQAADIPLVAQLYQAGSRRSLLAAQWDETLWKYELDGKDPADCNRVEIRMIETLAGRAVGFLCHPFFLWGEMFVLNVLELQPGVAWHEVIPSVIRYLWQTGENMAAENKKTLTGFGFWLGENHPALQVAAGRLPQLRRRYAWYLRVPDLPAFMRHIAPALEKRLAASPLSPFNGEVKLGFYRSGLNLKFEQDRLTVAEPWQPTTKELGKAGFPGLSFLQLLFGYRTLEDLTFAFPDCFVADELKPVLPVLFPHQPSDIWPVN